MSEFYLPLVVVHVLIAIFGIGSVSALVILAGVTRRNSEAAKSAPSILSPILRLVAISMGLMFITGLILGAVAPIPYHKFWWFRISFLLLIVLGALHGMIKGAVRKITTPNSDAIAALGRVQGLAYGMCLVVAIIVYLMQAKPF